MNSRQHIVQRYCDGTLDAAQASAAKELIDSSAELTDECASLDRLGKLFSQRRDHTVVSCPDELTAAIMDRLPEQAPTRQRSISAGSILAAIGIVALVGLGYLGLANSSSNALLMATVALASILGGLIVLVAAPMLLRPDSDLLQRLFGWRLLFSSDQQLLVRSIGIAIFLGGVIAAASQL